MILLVLLGTGNADQVQSRKLAKFDNKVQVYVITYKEIEYLIVGTGSYDGGVSIIPAAHQNLTVLQKAQPRKAVDGFRNSEW